jgi:hypothetical protein
MFYCVCGESYTTPPDFCDYCGSKEFVACYGCILALQAERRYDVKYNMARPATKMTEAEYAKEARYAKEAGPYVGSARAYVCLGKCKPKREEQATVIEGQIVADDEFSMTNEEVDKLLSELVKWAERSYDTSSTIIAVGDAILAG